ncbi:hypothetical protein PENTCL1PPCAC_16541, partial [Pristionchus entomophagus]
MEIYLSIESQSLIFSSQRCIFVLTSFLNGLSMFRLIKKTPPNHAAIRPYLIFMQVIVILSSLYLDVLFAPIPLFPAPGGYCIGVLCALGVRVHSVLGAFVLLLVLIGVAIISCSLFRHQTIISANHPLRVSKVSHSML